ncbi:DUF5819 family protein [Microbacterium sp. HD4P20]|uniref:DUF5819 family protein n=1 Tax=Microbacterium sp. HD4P20 TaxID=2864874 RepID=UPI001C63D5E8|nr:DUF5819 family protein [Microbacterium sp. HD4P20]MCP2635306.1 DUF5819 family protein [Microbacterium sp. HD4P20]
MTLVILVGYGFVSATFTQPSSPARPAVADAFAPYFSQRWNVFAPNILKANRELQIQVQWREDGELVHSDWIDVTDIEFGAVRGIPTPSRIQKNSYNATSAYMSRYSALTDEQRERVRDTFIERREGDEFGPISDDELIDDLDALGESRSSVIRFLRYDYMLGRFARAFGTAYFDREIERVRWRVQIERANDFLHRFDETAQYETTLVTFGWRQPTAEIDPQVLAIYDDIVQRYAGR